jgi:dTDP-4-dehydrorhamnose reductase
MRRLALVVGAGGQLGEAMTDQLGARHEVVAVTRSTLDVTDTGAVRAFVHAVSPDVIVNCSAYTNVDGAETQSLEAFQVNAMAVRALARAAGEADAALVHYSTDFVFDGRTDRPYTEDDAPNPRGAYAMSKLLGEWFAAEAPKHYVLRVASLFGGVRRHSSIDKILASLHSGAPVRAFADRTVSPSFVDDVVSATATLIERGAPYGLYHCVNTGWTTWAGIAHEVARLAGRPDAAIEETRMADAALLASRPLFAALSNAKLTAAGITMPTWEDALRRYVATNARGRC